jgi:hypothetical protein
MTRDEATARAVRYWIEKARECLVSADDESRAVRFEFAINRCYYAAFYAASATLLARGRRFVKHSRVRAAVHRDLVKPGFLPEEPGKLYDRLFHDRQQGDYVEFVSFDAEEEARTIAETSVLVRALESLVVSHGTPG